LFLYNFTYILIVIKSQKTEAQLKQFNCVFCFLRENPYGRKAVPVGLLFFLSQVFSDFVLKIGNPYAIISLAEHSAQIFDSYKRKAIPS